LSGQAEDIMTEAWKQWEGQVVNGEFHLRQYLGGSDHSAVFLTERGKREPEKAAIKLIPADPENAELQLSRWRQAATLSHPHLIRLFEMGRCHIGNTALLYIVMEYAEEDLSQILPQRPLTPAETRDMLTPTLNALAYVHEKGFVHGHLKPANVMAVADQVKISSDGLCRMGEPNGGLRKPGSYTPPGAVRGTIEPAGDVWSLGMTLVEVLTQRLPVWTGTEQGELSLPENIPAPFLEIARHCLLRDPQRRWTVAGIAALLKPAASPVPQKALPVKPLKKQEGHLVRDISRELKRLYSSCLQGLQPWKTDFGKLLQYLAGPQKAPAKRRYLIPSVVVGLVLVSIVVGARLLHRSTPPQPAVSVASEPPSVPSKPKQKPAAAVKKQLVQKPAEKKLVPAVTAPSATSSTPVTPSASLPIETSAKAPSGDLVRGEVLQQVLPDVPQKARDTIRGTVRVGVRVDVDPSGNVVGATFDSPGPSTYFANLALQAAQHWRFAPARVDGQSASSEWIVRFEFTNTTTKAVPSRATP
jgi:TonB family protein